jgi:hypothetical protein
MRFDPHQYAIEGGWDFTSIERTAAEGVSDEDERLIHEWMATQYESEAAARCASTEAIAALLAFCRRRVTEGA